MLQDKSLLIQSLKSVNISSGESQMSLSPDEVTVTAPTFSVYAHDSLSSSPVDQPPVLVVSNQTITVSADSLQVKPSNHYGYLCVLHPSAAFRVAGPQHSGHSFSSKGFIALHAKVFRGLVSPLHSC